MSRPPPSSISEPPVSSEPEPSEPSEPGEQRAVPPPPFGADAETDLTGAADADDRAASPSKAPGAEDVEEAPAKPANLLVELDDVPAGSWIERLRALPPRQRMLMGGATALAALLVIVIVWTSSGDGRPGTGPVSSATSGPSVSAPTTSTSAAPPADAAPPPTASSPETTSNEGGAAAEEGDAATTSGTASHRTKAKGSGTPTGKKKPPSIYGRK